MHTIHSAYLSTTLKTMKHIIPAMHELHLLICVLFKWFVSNAPNLIQYCSKTPNITLSGIFPKMKCLNSKKKRKRVKSMKLGIS